MTQQQHVMILEKTYLSGADEWYCPICGRRLLMNWEPKFQKTVLETGDEFAIHSGGKDGRQRAPDQVLPVDPVASQDNTISVQDPRLAPWIAWFDKVGFETLWNDER
jgi:hypothetical protein